MDDIVHLIRAELTDDIRVYVCEKNCEIGILVHDLFIEIPGVMTLEEEPGPAICICDTRVERARYLALNWMACSPDAWVVHEAQKWYRQRLRCPISFKPDGRLVCCRVTYTPVCRTDQHGLEAVVVDHMQRLQSNRTPWQIGWILNEIRDVVGIQPYVTDAEIRRALQK